MEKMYAFVILFKEIFAEYEVDAVSAECWTAMQLLVGAMPCTAYGILADMGYIIGCESDLHATITQVLLASAAFGEKNRFWESLPHVIRMTEMWSCYGTVVLLPIL